MCLDRVNSENAPTFQVPGRALGGSEMPGNGIRPEGEAVVKSVVNLNLT